MITLRHEEVKSIHNNTFGRQMEINIWINAGLSKTEIYSLSK